MKQLAPLIIALLLLLPACDFNGPGLSIDYEQIHSGLDALQMDPIDGAPPEEVFEDQNFNFISMLSNKGAADIKGGILKLIIEKDYIELKNQESIFGLEGRSIFNPKGGTNLTSFLLKAKKIPENMSLSHDSEMILTACYAYSTEVRKDVCIDTDYFNINRDNKEKVCTLGTIDAGSQGGPIEVFKIDPKFTTNEGRVVPEYLIYVRNAGEGQVVKEEDISQACGFEPLDSETWNTAYITATLEGSPMSCTPSEGGRGKLRLKNKEDFVKCTAAEAVPAGAASYVTVLMINVTYGYTSSISKNIKIKRMI